MRRTLLAAVALVTVIGCQTQLQEQTSDDAGEAGQSAQIVTNGKEVSMSLSQDQLKAVLQQTIDLPPLQPYYHVEQVPARRPLVMLLNDVVSDPVELAKFGEPVVWATREDVGDRAYLEVTALESDTNQVQVGFRYSAEGLAGSATFNHQDDQFTLIDHQLEEHQSR